MSLQEKVDGKSDNIVASMKKSAAENEQAAKEIEKLERLKKFQSQINKVANLSISDVLMKDNVRYRVDEESDDFQKLCDSIQTFGLMKNIVAELRILPNHEFELVCVSGHRRLTALKKLNYQEKIPVLIKQYEEGQRVGAALSENINRKDLNFVDLANGYLSLKKNGWQDSDLVKYFEKDRRTIERYLKLASFPEDIKNTIRENPEQLNVRVVFNEMLPKASAPNELRRLVERRLSRKTDVKTSTSSRRAKVQLKLEEYFREKSLPSEHRQIVLEALHYAGLLR